MTRTTRIPEDAPKSFWFSRMKSFMNPLENMRL